MALADRGLAAKAKRKISLGYDNFAVRAMGWKAPALVDYAAELGCDTLFITDFGPLEKLDDKAYLGDLAKGAADQGIDILLGSWSICPTAARFKDDWGSADEHLQLGVRMAKALGSPAFRVVLGEIEQQRRQALQAVAQRRANADRAARRVTQQDELLGLPSHRKHHPAIGSQLLHQVQPHKSIHQADQRGTLAQLIDFAGFRRANLEYNIGLTDLLAGLKYAKDT